MALKLYHRYTYDEASTAFRENAIFAEFLGSDGFIFLPSAVLWFVKLGNSLSDSHFESPSNFTWFPKIGDDDPTDWVSWINQTVNEFLSIGLNQKHHILVKPLTDNRYIYVGEAHLFNYGYSRNEKVRVRFSLEAKLPRKPWLDVGGSLLPKQPLAHLKKIPANPVTLFYHHNTFQLLDLLPQQANRIFNLPYLLAENNDTLIPEAIREWYAIRGSLDIMREILRTNHANEFDQPHYDKELVARYAVTAPSQQMFPIAFENQGVWHLTAPLDAGDNPPVYLGYDQDNMFDWHLHAHSFSDFIWAWTWDYVTYCRDYLMDVSTYLGDEDLAIIKETFYRGPQTYVCNAYFVYRHLRRYSNGDQKVTIMENGDSHRIWFSAESSESMKSLLTGPWVNGNILEANSELDIEMQKMYLW